MSTSWSRVRWDLGQVQANEIKVWKQRETVWMALALMISTRLWLGGVVGAKRDLALLRALAGQVRQWALWPARYWWRWMAWRPISRPPGRPSVAPTKKGSRADAPACTPGEEVAIVQVVKQRTRDTLTITRRIAQGTAEQVARLLVSSQNGGGINTAYIERLNATFRQRLCCLVRRGRALARQIETLRAGMYLVGCVYNFCTYHTSLRLDLWISSRRHRWVQRTPAVVARLTDQRWSLEDLLTFKLPITPFVPPKRRGRHPKQALQAVPL